MDRADIIILNSKLCYFHLSHHLLLLLLPLLLLLLLLLLLRLLRLLLLGECSGRMPIERIRLVFIESPKVRVDLR